MGPHSHQERIQHQFDSFCKVILKYSARDYNRRIKRRRAHETVFSELSEQDSARLFVIDEYFKEAHSFSVQGYSVAISDEQLAKALNTLPTDRRDIVLLACCLDMSDREIAERLSLVRSTVQYRRVRTLQELKKLMEGN